MVAGIKTNSTSAEGTNFWLLAQGTLAPWARWLNVPPLVAAALPSLELRVCGEGEHVRTVANLDFPLPLGIQFEAWTIPTNYIREPLISFSAVQGVAPMLSALPIVQQLGISPVPNQFFFWALNQGSVNTFMAAPLTNVTEQIDRVGPQLERDLNAWITNNALGWAEYSAPNHGINWMPVPLFAPTLQSLGSVVGPVLLGRVCPALPPLGEPGPPELLHRVHSQTNLLYFDWEITQARVLNWTFMAQSARMAFNRAQLSSSAPSLELLDAIAPKLGNAVTEVHQVAPSRLRFTRKAHCGLTGLELHILTDWLESPSFPRSTYTLSAPPAQVLRWRSQSRSFEITTNQAPVLNK
jgi:hypothetical protein